MKKAIVIGSTGLVGNQLIHLLLEDVEYSEVVSLVRRASGMKHPKLTEIIVDFDQPGTWSDKVRGDVLFSTMGTTIAKAKTKEEQFKVDFTYQFITAEMAAKNGVPAYVLISSAGADENSLIFYSNMKGKLEKAVSALPFRVISIIRPGILAGDRTENRTGEKIGLKIIGAINTFGLLKRYKPIHATQVAQAMINAANKTKSARYTLEEVFKLAAETK